ncbi:hypothetical protein Tco_0906305 [Tanacetum coccineum]
MCPANRYNYMTSNSAESINNLTRHVRKASITQLMKWYRALLQKWYCARREKYKGIPCGHVIAVGRTMGCTDCSELVLGWFRKTTLFSTYQELVYPVGEPLTWQCPDGLQVVKPPNMNFRPPAKPKNIDRIKSQWEEPIQVRCSRCGVRGHTRTSCHEPIQNHQESTLSSWKRSRQTRQESNIHINLGRRSQEYEAAYTNNCVRSQEYEAAYTNNYVRSQEYEAAYTNNYVRSQEYEAAYTNNYVRSQEYGEAYNNMDGRSQEGMYEQVNINLGGRSQDPHPTMPFAFNQFNLGQSSQQTNSTIPFTWDIINLADL